MLVCTPQLLLRSFLWARGQFIYACWCFLQPLVDNLGGGDVLIYIV